MSGILKRKFEEVEGASPCSSLRESEEEEISSSESGDSSDSVNPSASHFTRESSLLPLSSLSSSVYINVCFCMLQGTSSPGFEFVQLTMIQP